MRKKEGFCFRIGSFLCHVKSKRHANATGLELYIGKLNEAYRQNAKTIKSRRQT